MAKSYPTWETIVVTALKRHGGEASLLTLYQEVGKLCTETGRPSTLHIEAKIRQVCQKSKRIVQDEPGSGVWRLASGPGSVSQFVR